MFRSTTSKIAGFVGTVAVSAALIATATGSTGAYFSDTRSGTLSGTSGSIKVTTSGGSGADGLDFSFTNLLPGELQTRKATYVNTGNSVQDVWVVFNDAAALHALNQVGRYAEVHLASDGVEFFASKNLNDNSVSCPESDGCRPLKSMYKLAENVGAGGTGSMTFTYGLDDYASGHQDSPWLGLPFQIVATQHGVTPGQSADLG